MEDRKNIVEFIHAKDIELLILNYLEEKANIIKENDPYNFVRLNEIKSELRRIFSPIVDNLCCFTKDLHSRSQLVDKHILSTKSKLKHL